MHNVSLNRFNLIAALFGVRTENPVEQELHTWVQDSEVDEQTRAHRRHIAEMIREHPFNTISIPSIMKIKTVPMAIFSVQKLTQLIIEGQDFPFLPKEIGQLTALRLLCIQGCKTKSISPEIGNLTELKHLTISNNNLTYIPKEIGLLLKLTLIHLYKNPFTSLPLELGQLPEIPVLHFSQDDFAKLLTSQDIQELQRRKIISTETRSLFQWKVNDIPGFLAKIPNDPHEFLFGDIKNGDS